MVIDGTWRKSRRMLYGSRWLQGLPRLALVDPPPARYRVRRARGSQQRSTFEAVFEAFVDRLDRQGTGADPPPIEPDASPDLASRPGITNWGA